MVVTSSKQHGSILTCCKFREFALKALSTKVALGEGCGVFRLFLLLAACSSDSLQARVSGDESYLDAAPLAELHAPAGTDPADNDRRLAFRSAKGAARLVGVEYPSASAAVSVSERRGVLGLLCSDTATLLVENGRGGTLWPQVVSVIRAGIR